ncbi:MAG: MBL fold metallo-hydrolase [Calditrichia bacterium]
MTLTKILTMWFILTIWVLAGDFHSRHFELVKINDDIYAAIHKPGGSAICNAGIIDMGDYVIIFDSFMTTIAARDLRDAANHLFNKPIRFVINSHGHSDHIRGNQIFPEATVIGTELMRTFIMEKSQPGNEKSRLDERINKIRLSLKEGAENNGELEKQLHYYLDLKKSLEELKLTLPNLSINNEIIIRGQNRRVVLHEYKSGHSISDIILHIPEDSVLFTGDLIFNNTHPNMRDSYPGSWITNLDSLLLYSPRIVIPGHGEIGGIEIIHKMKSYFHTLEQISAEAIRKGLNLEESEQVPMMPEIYKSYNFPYFYRSNLLKMVNYLKSRNSLE